MRELHCGTCGDDMPFEAPPCADGHGAECPELACTGCGSAVLLGSLLPARAGGESRRSRSPVHGDRPRTGKRPRSTGPRRLAA